MAMSRGALAAVLFCVMAPWCAAQVAPTAPGRGKAPQTQAPPRSDQPNAGESSSKDHPIDPNPLPGEYDAPDVNEFKKYDPHRAAKDLEVGDYYAKQGNYRGALLRYQDALEYVPNDPAAIFRLATAYEQVQRP